MTALQAWETKAWCWKAHKVSTLLVEWAFTGKGRTFRLASVISTFYTIEKGIPQITVPGWITTRARLTRFCCSDICSDPGTESTCPMLSGCLVSVFIETDVTGLPQVVYHQPQHPNSKNDRGLFQGIYLGQEGPKFFLRKKKKSVSGPCPGWGLDISAGATAPGLTFLRLWTQPMSCRTCTICYILTLRAFTNFSHRRGPKYPHNRDTWARNFANSCGAVARTKGKATTTVVPTSQNAYSAYEAEKMGMWR